MFSQTFINDLYALQPSKSLLANVDKQIREALLYGNSQKVDALFAELDVNCLADSMVAQLDVSTKLYENCLHNREKFFRRAHGSIKRKWLRVAATMGVLTPKEEGES